jgi:hypothetical protein
LPDKRPSTHLPSKTFRTWWYGNETPTTVRNVAINGFMAGLLLVWYACAYAVFLPSDGWSIWGIRVAVVLTLIVSAWWYWRLITGKHKLAPRTRGLSKVFVVLFMPFMIYGYFWVTVARGIPDLITWIAGQPTRVRALLTAAAVDEGVCKLRGPLFAGRFPDSYVRVKAVFCDMLGAGSEVVLEGRRTVFGLRVSRVLVVPMSNVKEVPHEVRR